MSGSIPSGWQVAQLSDMATQVTDKWEPGYELQFPYIGLEHLGQGTGTILEIGSSKGLTSLKTHFAKGDVLFGKLRPNLRKTALVEFDGIASTDIIALRAFPSVDPKFLFYTVSSEPCFEHAIRSAAGTKMPRTSWSQMGGYRVLLPPLPEQRRIAETLSSVDEAIQATQAVIEQTHKVRHGILKRLLTRGLQHATLKQTEIGELPEHWEVSTVGAVCSSVSVGIASSATHAYSAEGIPLIRNQNIKAGYLDLTDLLFVSEEYSHSNASKRVRTGDVVSMRTGYPGRSAVIPPELDGCQTFTTLISRPNRRLITPEFLCHWINSDAGMNEVRKRQAGGAQQNLNAGVLKGLPVPLPPLQEQVGITRVLDGFPLEDTGMLDTLHQMKASLMSDLLTGRKRVSGDHLMAAE